MKKIYISIPITGLDEKRQREKADRIKMSLSRDGWQPINPFDVYVGPDPASRTYLGTDVRIIIDYADVIFMCDGWERSKGCQVEKFVAETYGKTVMYEPPTKDMR